MAARALAMEPAVGKLATRMPRAAATGLVMGAVLLGLTIFLGLFGSLLFQQLAQLVQAIPDVVTGIFDWVNSKFGTQYSTDTILSDLGLTTSQITSYADDIAGGVLGLVGGVLGAFLSLFSVTFFSYFMSAGLVRLRRWVAALFPARQQEVVLTTWEMLRIKVGGYVASRLVLAAISSLTSGIFMALIGMPYWLALALWTGLVAQFIPNVGTYIAIALPVVVGLTSTNPMLGVWVLIFAIAYQQVENLTLEPRISARAVNVHPAVSFASALLGAELFGISGATLGVPVAATLMAVFDIYKQRYAVSPETEERIAARIAATGGTESSEVEPAPAPREGDSDEHTPQSETGS
jgi:predicted PurR-regulated permease PerM